jgi:hypothetical protein
VLDTAHPLKFLHSGRSLASVMSRNRKLWTRYQQQYGTQFTTVGDYYQAKGTAVELVGIAHLLPPLSPSVLADVEDEP